MAILCKATGMGEAALRALWRATRGPRTTAPEEEQTSAALEDVVKVFHMIAVDRAQTVLRYWNWALASGLPVELLKAIKASENQSVEELSLAEGSTRGMDSSASAA